jgi:N-acetyl-anhydromuramyl-L-alanine amidase AmpD
MALRKTTTHCIIHCSATPPSMDIGAEEIDQWHKANGWNGIGYHYVIRRDGMVELGRPLQDIGAHARGYNSCSVGVCMVGGTREDYKDRPENNFTPEQWGALAFLLNNITNTYRGIKIIGHNDVADKACPSFDVQEYLNPKPQWPELCPICNQPLLPFLN